MLDYAYFAVFIVLTNNGFFCVIEKGINFNRRQLEKASFCIRYNSKRKQKPAKINTEQCLTHVNEPACEIWSCFDDFHFLPKIASALFWPNPSIHSANPYKESVNTDLKNSRIKCACFFSLSINFGFSSPLVKGTQETDIYSTSTLSLTPW